eukprot:TRINITY_DN68505_c0_g1_i1.p1 TRINITY_DN68505_c0_g1~~TRINITY_DN68505_c0_g1_i1.p1  ORF type:complete len:541 (-),score=98.99 TRINITY_DN68505_c0_g1_i1:54-1676(-)
MYTVFRSTQWLSVVLSSGKRGGHGPHTYAGGRMKSVSRLDTLTSHPMPTTEPIGGKVMQRFSMAERTGEKLNRVRAESMTPTHATPKHHQKTVAELEAASEKCDFFVEVRDARAPFATENKRMHSMMYNKPRVICFNKMDLGVPEMERKVLSFYARHGIPACYTYSSGNHTWGHEALLEAITNLPVVQKHDVPSVGLVVGMPNTGKSLLIDRLRAKGLCNDQITKGQYRWKRSRMKESFVSHSVPHTTKMFNSALVQNHPKHIILTDTPGFHYPVMMQDEELALKLAALEILTPGDNNGLNIWAAAAYLMHYMMNRPVNRRLLLAFLHLTEDDVPTKASTPLHILQRFAVLLEAPALFHDMWAGISGIHATAISMAIFKCIREGRFGPICLDDMPAEAATAVTEVIGARNPAVTPLEWTSKQSIAFGSESVLSDATAFDRSAAALPRSLRTYGNWKNRDAAATPERQRPSWLSPMNDSRRPFWQGPTPLHDPALKPGVRSAGEGYGVGRSLVQYPIGEMGQPAAPGARSPHQHFEYPQGF